MYSGIVVWIGMFVWCAWYVAVRKYGGMVFQMGNRMDFIVEECQMLRSTDLWWNGVACLYGVPGAWVYGGFVAWCSRWVVVWGLDFPMRIARCMVTWWQECTVALSFGDMALGRLGYQAHGGKEIWWLLRAL